MLAVAESLQQRFIQQQPRLHVANRFKLTWISGVLTRIKIFIAYSYARNPVSTHIRMWVRIQVN